MSHAKNEFNLKIYFLAYKNWLNRTFHQTSKNWMSTRLTFLTTPSVVLKPLRMDDPNEDRSVGSLHCLRYYNRSMGPRALLLFSTPAVDDSPPTLAMRETWKVREQFWECCILLVEARNDPCSWNRLRDQSVGHCQSICLSSDDQQAESDTVDAISLPSTVFNYSRSSEERTDAV